MDQTARCSTTIYTCQPVHTHSGQPQSQRSEQGGGSRSTRPRPALIRMMGSVMPWINLQHAPQGTSNWEPGSIYLQRGRLVRRAAPRGRPPTRFPAAYMPSHYLGPGHGRPQYYDPPPPSMPPRRDPLRQHAANIRRLERELRQVRGEPEPARRRRRTSHSPAPSSTSSSSSSTSSSSSASTCSSASSPHRRFTYSHTRRGEPGPLNQQPTSPALWQSSYGDEDYAYDQGSDQGCRFCVPSQGGLGQDPTRPRRVTFAVREPRWQDVPHFDPCRGPGVVREPHWR